MNIKFIDNYIFNIYMRKEQIKDVNVKNKKELEIYLQKIISKLKKICNINIEGFYNVNVYIDKYYGIIFNFNREKLEYYDYFSGVEVNIKIKEVSFLYEVDDITFDFLSKLEIEKINNNIYLKVIKELSQKEFINLIEHTKKIIEI